MCGEVARLLDSYFIYLKMLKSKQYPEKSNKEVYNSFIWSDDEIELLKVTLEYKTSRTIENVDIFKYGDIFKLYLDQYATPANAAAIEKDFPHKK